MTFQYLTMKMDELEKRIRALEQEPCGDAISRTAVLNTLDTMDKALDENRTVEEYKELLKECYEQLPSVNVSEKVGKWMMPDEGFNVKIWRKCSYCKRHIETFFKYTDFSDTIHYIPYKLNYCPLCGAEMVKREDKE